MVDGIKGQQSAAISRIAENAEAAGITPSQLQQLLKGVTFDTGMFGKMAPQQVKDAFAGAALALAKKDEPTATRVEEKYPAQVRQEVIGSATTAARATELLDMILKGKDVAGLPDRAYTDGRTPAGPDVNFKLLLDALPQQLTMAEAKTFVLGLFDTLTAAAKTGQLPLWRDSTLAAVHGLQVGLAKRGFDGATVKELISKGAALQTAFNNPDLRERDGKIALPSSTAQDHLKYLTNSYGWSK